MPILHVGVIDPFGGQPLVVGVGLRKWQLGSALVGFRCLELRVYRRCERSLVRNRLTARIRHVREPGGVPGVVTIAILPTIVILIPGHASTKQSHQFYPFETNLFRRPRSIEA